MAFALVAVNFCHRQTVFLRFSQLGVEFLKAVWEEFKLIDSDTSCCFCDTGHAVVRYRPLIMEMTTSVNKIVPY